MLEWDTFFLLTGRVSAILASLFIIVIIVISKRKKLVDHIGLKQFLTTTVFHFGVVFIVALLILFPNFEKRIGLLGLWLGGFGIIYLARLAIGFGRERSTRLDWHVWLFQILFPTLGYLALVLGWLQPALELNYFAAGVVILLLVGIRNTWAAAT